ncbi:hypothetical protein A3709_20130 [Halioglobus sp. HI00S01]|uniref:fimbria/pilus periplasmic chaperone n=1 Tax=Halioglobus sp. HI00S01 TaxID=1822214 RepID=UPI0007C3C1C9|nr:fimbria/pilus periplasmic chaperone [Halioglobus sp. HI00S01]KZX57935.1 hypothetical protein A3709_20130 [Halioglobus sp. HI00S01]
MASILPQFLSVVILGIGLINTAVVEAGNPKPRMGLSPARFEFEWAGVPINDSLAVLNMSNSSLGVEVSIRTWDLDDKNNTRLLPPSETSLDRAFIINPRYFTIPPGSQQSLRFSIRPKEPLIDGEHRAMIFVKELPADQEESAPDVGVRFNYGLPVYVHSGPVSKTGVLHSISIGSNAASSTPVLFDFSSTGSSYSRLKGQIVAWPIDSFPGEAVALDVLEDIKSRNNTSAAADINYTQLPAIPVLPGTRRTIEVHAGDIERGVSYMVLVAGSIGDVTFEKFLTLDSDNE